MTDKSFLNRMKNLLFTGLLVVVPFLAAVWMSWWIYDVLTVWAIGLADKLDLPGIKGEISSFWVRQGIRILALVFMLLVLLLVGQLAKLTLGRRLIGLGQKLLMHLPLVSFIYSTCKQIADAMQTTSGGMFHQVVLFEYPMPGSYAIGFLTNENTEPSEITEQLGKPVVSIFLPTTPNPTSGFLLMIPRDKCIFLKMSVSDAMKLIVSIGTVFPEQKAQELSGQ
ncbi:MAG: DUF502 domain-containing protein [Lentisphaerae bacterium]|nr:DUF502 domain-containing protein [Lentisphaerota bacterium]